jgi:peptide/nickel transport system substrate-binding protein
VFRILPDNLSRLQELKSGGIDAMGGLEPLDIADLNSSAPSIRIISIPGRQYFFVGWNNVDGTAYAGSKGASVHPHPLFGSAMVRRALTYAINRSEIMATLLGNWGKEGTGPISPLFRWATNDTLTPWPYDPAIASRLLAAEGWIDRDGDGIREKGGHRFSFPLIFPAGDQFYLDIANLVQRQLREVGIDVHLQPVDGSVFFPTLMEKKYDACVAGFEVPLQIQMDDFWNSDLQRYPFNVVSFRNRRVDQILASARRSVKEVETGPLWKEFQAIMHQEQPCTFLFWSSRLVGVNRRVHGTSIGILGTLYHAWEWRTDESTE